MRPDKALFNAMMGVFFLLLSSTVRLQIVSKKPAKAGTQNA